MHAFSFNQLLTLGLLVVAPLTSAYVAGDATDVDLVSKRHVGGIVARAALEARHHTEAQIAAKTAKATKKKHGRSVDIEVRDPHHTEAQIAAKTAKTTKKKHGRSVDIEARDPEAHHTEAQIAAKKAKTKPKAAAAAPAPAAAPPAASPAAATTNCKRDPHHTEAQIAAKQKAGATNC